MPVTLTSHYGKDYQLLRKSERWYVTLMQNARVMQYNFFIRPNFATRFKPAYLLPTETALNDTALNINPCTNDHFRKSAFNLHYRISSLALEMSSYKDSDPSQRFICRIALYHVRRKLRNKTLHDLYSLTNIIRVTKKERPIPVASRSKAWVCGR